MRVDSESFRPNVANLQNVCGIWANRHEGKQDMIKKRNILFTVLTFAKVLFSMAQTTFPNRPVDSIYDINKTFSVEELRFDLGILKDALIKCHPGLFWHQSQKEFEAKYYKLRNEVNRPMTDLEFYTILTPFIGSIKCDHTNMEMSEAFSDVNRNATKVFPLILKIIDKHVYIYQNYSNDRTIQQGSEILSINGIGADSILKFVKPRSWADGFVESYASLNIESISTPLLLSFFHQPEFYKIKMKKPDGVESSLTCEAVVYKIFRERYNKQQAIKLCPEYEHFSFSIIDSLSIGIIKINAFEGDNYYRFLNNSFSQLKEKQIENLIIDLRGNGGGDGEYVGPLYRKFSLKEYREIDRVEMVLGNPKDSILNYCKVPDGEKEFLKFYRKYVYKIDSGKYSIKYGQIDDHQKKPFKPRKDAYTGNVFFLTDVQTSSCGSQLSMLAHYNRRAKFIGRETGGGYMGNTSGWVLPFTLPNSKIIVYIPIIRTINVATGNAHRGVSPDYPIMEDINDVIFHKDSELLFTLDLIKKSKNKKKE